MLKVVSVASVILEWNKLDIDIRNFTSINIFIKSFLQFSTDHHPTVYSIATVRKALNTK